MNIPKQVLLCGIGYYVTVADNMVMFSTKPGIAGCYTRLMFQRVYGCWYVSITDSDDKAMVAHVIEAHKLIAKWFGGDHECKSGENKP